MLPSRITLLLSALTLTVLPPAASADEWLTVGSWNIENLGQRLEGQQPKPLAEHLQLTGLDVLVLQEIHDTDGNTATRRNRKLDDSFAILNALPDNDWEYILFPKRELDDVTQHVGVAWNKKRVSKVGDPFKVPVVDNEEAFDLWERHPHALKLSAGAGKTDFVVIPLHMKSNVDGTTFGRNQRNAEVTELIHKLGEVRTHFNDQDVILLGDMNCLDADEPALQQLDGAGFRDLNDGDLATYRSGDPFDRVLVPEGQSEFRFSRQYVLTPTDALAHEGSLSDHFLIVSIFKVVADDD